jgi:hypothetical protein
VSESGSVMSRLLIGEQTHDRLFHCFESLRSDILSTSGDKAIGTNRGSS